MFIGFRFTSWSDCMGASGGKSVGRVASVDDFDAAVAIMQNTSVQEG